jgi:hypothetical protein
LQPTSLPKRNRKRASKRYARDFGDEAAIVRAMPCLVTGATPSDPAHVTSRGAGGGRFDLVPLSPALHRQQHLVGVDSFAGCYRLDLRAEADRVALAHPLPLGLRGVALRWVKERLRWRRAQAAARDLVRSDGAELVAVCRLVDEILAIEVLGAWTDEALTDYEAEALFGYVRRRGVEGLALTESQGAELLAEAEA